MKKQRILVGLRDSKLSIKQSMEVLNLILKVNPSISFDLKPLKTEGDKDQKRSLKEMDKTNFFTKEIDDLLLEKKVEIAIHSAKDLPNPLPYGLQIVALTASISQNDVLVVNQKVNSSLLMKSIKVGVSSLRREKAVLKSIPKSRFYEIRGSIEKRLSFIDEGKLDGVVIAKAALIRLEIFPENQIDIGIGAPKQGQLALVARKDNFEMANLFSSIDTREKGMTLYLGTDPMGFKTHKTILHTPIIQVKKRVISKFDGNKIVDRRTTHIIFTSKNSVHFFVGYLKRKKIFSDFFQGKTILSIGKSTEKVLKSYNLKDIITAKMEVQEGVISLLEDLDYKRIRVLYPKSSRARKKLCHYMDEALINYEMIDLYDTMPVAPPRINWTLVEEVVFTSPSTVESFFEMFKDKLTNRRVRTIGPITKKYFEDRIERERINFIYKN